MQEQSNFTAQELRAKAPVLLGFDPHIGYSSNSCLLQHVKHVCLQLSPCRLYCQAHVIQRTCTSIVSILQLRKQTEINGFAIVT